mmetsp:Transcript_48179/g.142419  ORF Transcript_48179/g.142419 Transcript_48179/m.142419 type:complete len:226 (-) Transcript_48179:354-1031(-)
MGTARAPPGRRAPAERRRRVRRHLPERRSGLGGAQREPKLFRPRVRSSLGARHLDRGARRTIREVRVVARAWCGRLATAQLWRGGPAVDGRVDSTGRVQPAAAEGRRERRGRDARGGVVHRVGGGCDGRGLAPHEGGFAAGDARRAVRPPPQLRPPRGGRRDAARRDAGRSHVDRAHVDRADVDRAQAARAALLCARPPRRPGCAAAAAAAAAAAWRDPSLRTFR